MAKSVGADCNEERDCNEAWSPVNVRGLILIATLACAGCYDAEKMVQHVRNDLEQSQLVEVDFGKYYVTLPRDKQSGALYELGVHYFGYVPPYRAGQVKSQLASADYRLRHETLLALRNTTHEELAEPELAILKERLKHLVNEILDESPVEAIGLYEIQQIPR